MAFLHFLEVATNTLPDSNTNWRTALRQVQFFHLEYSISGMRRVYVRATCCLEIADRDFVPLPQA
jgi:hypothetical protein